MEEKLDRIIEYLDDEMARYEDISNFATGDYEVSINSTWRKQYEINCLTYEALTEFEKENEELNRAKDLIAMKYNWYMRRYEAYREALKEIIDITPEYFAKRTAEDALKLEQKIYKGKTCDYCESIDEATPASPRKKYNFCPICGQARRD